MCLSLNFFMCYFSLFPFSHSPLLIKCVCVHSYSTSLCAHTFSHHAAEVKQVSIIRDVASILRVQHHRLCHLTPPVHPIVSSIPKCIHKDSPNHCRPWHTTITIPFHPRAIRTLPIIINHRNCPPRHRAYLQNSIRESPHNQHSFIQCRRTR